MCCTVSKCYFSNVYGPKKIKVQTIQNKVFCKVKSLKSQVFESKNETEIIFQKKRYSNEYPINWSGFGVFPCKENK